MDRIETFWRYLWIFIAFFLVVNFLTNLSTKKVYTNMDYRAEFSEPVLRITEAKSTYSRGYIEGKITNTTGSIIDLKYLKFELYNEKGTYLGTVFKELKYFNEKETIEFRVDYTRHHNVDFVLITLEDEQIEREPDEMMKFIKIWTPVVFIVAKLYTL